MCMNGKKSYWCPRCGRMFTYRAAWEKHINSKKCKIDEHKREKSIRAAIGALPALQKNERVHQNLPLKKGSDEKYNVLYAF